MEDSPPAKARRMRMMRRQVVEQRHRPLGDRRSSTDLEAVREADRTQRRLADTRRAAPAGRRTRGWSSPDGAAHPAAAVRSGQRSASVRKAQRTLQPGQRRAQAVVDAAGERQVLRLAAPVEAEPVRVRRTRPGRGWRRPAAAPRTVPCGQPHARPARGPRARTGPSAGPAGRSAGSPRRPRPPGRDRRPEPRQLSGSCCSAADAVADQVDRGLEPGHQQQPAGRHQVVGGELAAGLGRGQQADHVVAGLAATLVGEPPEQDCELPPACRSSWAWRTVRTPSRDWPTSSPIREKWAASASGMPSSRLITAIGNGAGQVGHQVEPVPPLQPVEDLGQHLVDHRGEVPDQLGPERRRGQPPQPGVPRWVELQEGPAQRAPGRGRIRRGALSCRWPAARRTAGHGGSPHTSPRGDRARTPSRERARSPRRRGSARRRHRHRCGGAAEHPGQRVTDERERVDHQPVEAEHERGPASDRVRLSSTEGVRGCQAIGAPGRHGRRSSRHRSSSTDVSTMSGASRGASRPSAIASQAA